MCAFTSRHWFFFGSSHRIFISQHTYINRKASVKKNVSFENNARGASTMKDPDADLPAAPGGLCLEVAILAPECDLGRWEAQSGQVKDRS